VKRDGKEQSWAMRILAAVLVLFAAAFTLTAKAPGPDAKIEPKLMTMLIDSDDGTAPFFVVFGERTSLEAAFRMKDWTARGQFVVNRLQAAANRSQNGVRGYLQGRKIVHTSFWVENKIYIPNGTLELARDLARRPEVAAIIRESIYSIPPTQTGAGIQSVLWNIGLIGANQVWATDGNGTGSVVASIDTGVQYNHPALVNQYRGNTGGVFNHTGNWYDATNTCTAAPCDNVGHGTHTVGTMVGSDGSVNQIGVAPGARWIACKGCANTTCAGSALTACAQWIMAPGGSTANRPNVVNNSWGDVGGDPWYRSYVQSWVAAGIFPAFSAGNSGPSCSTAGSPGDYVESFASGATDSIDNIASFSSRGPSTFGGVKPNVSAPGVNIYSSYPTNNYDSMSGTSMASPHTAGSVALLWSVLPGYKGNIAGTKALLAGNAVIRGTTETCGGISAGASPNNTYGSGRLDVKRAVDAGKGVPVNQPPTVTITTPGADGQQFNCGPAAVSFAASASDPESGTLTTAIQWSGPGTPAIGVGGSISKTFSCTTELGNQTITAQVTDAGGLSVADTVVVNIVNVALPTAPSGLTTTVSGSNVTLRWTDNSTNESGFYVYRRKQLNGKKWGAWGRIATSVTASYTDIISGKGSFQYYVSAFNTAGESAPSAPSGTVTIK
jgi:subtilisin family serine protease